ncbi:MAG: hypothetical protein ABI818_09720 [Acidobacteriota bacterium]
MRNPCPTAATPDVAAGDAGPVALPVWLTRLACVVALTGAAVCLYSMRQVDPDLYGYLAYGRLFAERGATGVHDPFAYTSAAFTWVTFEYLAQLALWTAYAWAGPVGLIALKCAVGGAALYFLFAAIRLAPASPFVWVPAFLLCASTLSRFFLFRPQLFTFAFFALFVAVLFRFLIRRRAPLWILPIAMLVWANTHGGFVAGLGAVGLAILVRVAENLAAQRYTPARLFDGTRRLWATLLAAAAATFVTPLGFRLWGYILTELSHGTNRRYIAEWGPASLSNDPWSAVMLTLISATLTLAGWLAHRLRRPDDPPVWPWVASAVPLIAMSYLSVRHVPLAAIWAGPVVALLGGRIGPELAALVLSRRLWFIVRGFAAVPVCLTLGIVVANPFPAIRADGRVLGRTHPCGAVQFLREHAIAANLYTPLWWGAYITWELYPSVRVSMDGRNISLYSRAMVLENLKFYSDPAPSVDAGTPLRYDTDLLLVPSDSAAVGPVLEDTRWRRIYADDDAVLFARASGRAHGPSISLVATAAPAHHAGCSPVLN